MASASGKAKRDDEARAEEARRILDKVEGERHTFAESHMARNIEKRLFDTPDDDPVERWGRIIGRTLGFLFLLYLVYHLLTTYVLA